jgi:hypothetical protein
MELPLYIIFIFVSAIAGIALVKRAPARYLQIFPFFLLSSGIVEWIGWFRGDRGDNNTEIYNFLSAYEFTFYLYMLRLIIVNRTVKKILLPVIYIYPLACLVNIFFIQGIDAFHSITYCTGCLLIVLVCIFYFFELFQLQHSINLVREPSFWICSSLLFFCTVSFPLLGMTNYIYTVSPIIIDNFSIILKVMNVLLYALFAIAFLCQIRIRRTVV